jgi:hypothetical protein
MMPVKFPIAADNQTVSNRRRFRIKISALTMKDAHRRGQKVLNGAHLSTKARIDETSVEIARLEYLAGLSFADERMMQASRW